MSARAFIRAEKKPEGGTRSTTTTQNLNPENPQAQKVLDDEQAARDQAATDAREQAEAQQAQAEAAQAQAQAQAAAAASSNGDAEGGGGGGHGH